MPYELWTVHAVKDCQNSSDFRTFIGRTQNLKHKKMRVFFDGIRTKLVRASMRLCICMCECVCMFMCECVCALVHLCVRVCEWLNESVCVSKRVMPIPRIGAKWRERGETKLLRCRMIGCCRRRPRSPDQVSVGVGHSGRRTVERGKKSVWKVFFRRFRCWLTSYDRSQLRKSKIFVFLNHFILNPFDLIISRHILKPLWMWQ